LLVSLQALQEPYMRLNLFTAVALALVSALLPGVKPPSALKAPANPATPTSPPPGTQP